MNINEVTKVIKAARAADDTVLIEGVHGIGKSQIVQQFAKENNMCLVELFLSHQETGDLIGIPHKVEKDGSTITTWAVPVWLQRMYQAAANGQHCILFLDELNRAPIDVRQSALQLVLERQIHEHKLPEVQGLRTMVVAAINPASGDYQVDELDSVLIDRFLHVKVECDVSAWMEWARKPENNVAKIVRDFISEHPNRLHYTPADGGVGATPRSWTKLAAYMKDVKNIPEEILVQIMKGKVGTELGSQFYTFFKNYNKVVKIDDIEAIIKKYTTQLKNKTVPVEDVADKITQLMAESEVIQKTEMIHQFYAKYKDKTDLLPFLVYLYSLDVEIFAGWLQEFRKEHNEDFLKIVKIDEEMYDKQLFRRIVKAADKK